MNSAEVKLARCAEALSHAGFYADAAILDAVLVKMAFVVPQPARCADCGISSKEEPSVSFRDDFGLGLCGDCYYAMAGHAADLGTDITRFQHFPKGY